MAIVRTDDTHYQAIADEIRLQRGNDNSKWLPETMPIGISTACMNQYNTGFSEGREDGFNEGMTAGAVDGRRAEYDRFWDAYQPNKGVTNYLNAFSGYRWVDEVYDPKYPMIVEYSGNNMFAYSAVTDTKVEITVSESVTGNWANAFAYSSLKTIRKLTVHKGAAMNTQFTNATKLENIEMGGVVGKNCNMQWCPLTADSIRSVVSALSDIATGCAATFNKAAKEAAFTDEEWAALIAKKPNWTFSLV